MRRRTTALGVILATFVAISAAQARGRVPSPIVFPLLGEVSYTDDFGQPRPGGPHQGNDLVAPRKAIAVAAESGKVVFWTTSPGAGCMLYLYGDSGTNYEYIHLNNDVGAGNDNKGSCVAGTAYAPGLVDGARVAAGDPVGFVGDSGDANGIHPHLHFEVHPRGGKAVSPYPFLQKAQHLLFSAAAGTSVTLVLTGSVVAAAGDQVTLDVSLLREWPAHQRVTKPGEVTVTVPAEVMDASSLVPGERVSVWTAPVAASFDAELGTGWVARRLAAKAALKR
jgi:hypothetical protein